MKITASSTLSNESSEKVPTYHNDEQRSQGCSVQQLNVKGLNT